MCQSVCVMMRTVESVKVKTCLTDNLDVREGIVPWQVETTWRVHLPRKKNSLERGEIVLPYPGHEFPLHILNLINRIQITGIRDKGTFEDPLMMEIWIRNQVLTKRFFIMNNR